MVVSTSGRLNWSLRDFVHGLEKKVGPETPQSTTAITVLSISGGASLKRPWIPYYTVVPRAVEDVFVSELHGLINRRYFDGNTTYWGYRLFRCSWDCPRRSSHLACIPSTTPREPTRPSSKLSQSVKAILKRFNSKVITSIVCHSQAVKKSNFLASTLALYLDITYTR